MQKYSCRVQEYKYGFGNTRSALKSHSVTFWACLHFLVSLPGYCDDCCDTNNLSESRRGLMCFSPCMHITERPQLSLTPVSNPSEQTRINSRINVKGIKPVLIQQQGLFLPLGQRVNGIASIKRKVLYNGK